LANRPVVVVLASLACVVVLPACYTPVRHRVLTFFFDGVPEPGTRPTVGYAPPTTTEEGELGAPRERPGVVGEIYAHPPYRNDRCGTCHDFRTGELTRTPQEGLCKACHMDIPGRATYAHGPVAVDACLFCHHHHTAAHPKVLRYNATATCFRCHKRADLTKGPHHETIDQEACVTCHNPHGGADRFFLKRDEP
jgi:predicted CXXCH cytochrome family protein